ncbi:hypothetical protein GOBAR_AA34822 [Gossypium barbadense]|uniref:Uncharacterized protein n=1 Tax=Gossypium barbadense TaxID=3634 RepID=A0A2P5W426_GOSBA|nr:hypothetical protein GOBAR_AA34822 [Gossypium barbadense]
MEALYKLDLQGKADENWRDYHKEHIDIWDHRMKFLPICKPFSYVTCAYLEYMPWFRVADKPCLLLVKAKSRELRQKMPRRHHIMHHRSTLHLNLSQVHILGYLRPQHISPDADVDVDANADINVDACTDIDGETNVVINASIDAHINVDVSGFYDIV